jgi:hypothetical protein
MSLSSNKSTASSAQRGWISERPLPVCVLLSTSSTQRGWISERPLPVCVLLSSSSALIPLVVICKCGNTNYHKKINTCRQRTQQTTIYVVHPNVGLRPPSAGIDYLIIQLMEITDRSHSSQTHSQPLRAYKFIAIY